MRQNNVSFLPGTATSARVNNHMGARVIELAMRLEELYRQI